MWLKEMFVFFMSLALGYILCVVARKQKAALKTLGYTIGISIMVLTFAYALLMAYASPIPKDHGCGFDHTMKKMPMMKHHR